MCSQFISICHGVLSADESWRAGDVGEGMQLCMWILNISEPATLKIRIGKELCDFSKMFAKMEMFEYLRENIAENFAKSCIFANIEESIFFLTLRNTSKLNSPMCVYHLVQAGRDVGGGGGGQHSKQFSVYIFPKRIYSQASLLIPTKYFQNRIVIFCLELWYLVDKYSTVLNAVIHLSAQGTTYFQRE
jgi:hypothetical protein